MGFPIFFLGPALEIAAQKDVKSDAETEKKPGKNVIPEKLHRCSSPLFFSSGAFRKRDLPVF
jgi:hypothetical protein